MAFTLWLVSVIIEVALVAKLPFLYKLLERYTLVAIVFSFALSVLVGTVFGAHGMIVMLAGMGSTVTTMVLYKYHFLEHARECHRAIKETTAAVRTLVGQVGEGGRRFAKGYRSARGHLVAMRHPIRAHKGEV